MTAAETYASRIDAVNAQFARLHGEKQADRWGGGLARRFRMDPHRRLDANLEIIASYVQPVDTVIDVGGGAGRISLPLALRCPQVINVDPSPGMRAEFEALVAEAGITNARFVQSDWLKAEGIQGDLSITANVTYFVRDIVPFIEKMEAASGRRVMVIVWSVPPPNQRSKLFRLVYGEDQELAPGHRELLPVLWEMGILPDMRVFPGLPLVPGAPLATQFPQTPEEAMQLAFEGQWLSPEDQERARSLIEARFYEFFAKTPQGLRPLWPPAARQLLITWETSQS